MAVKSISMAYNIEKRKDIIPQILDIAIPSDWCCISGKMHAPLKLIESKHVAARIVLEIEPADSAEDKQKIDKCYLHICPTDVYNNCKYNLPSMGHMADVLSQEKLPCGLFLNHAGLCTGNGLYYPKHVIMAYAKKGYVIKLMNVYQGFRIDISDKTTNYNKRAKAMGRIMQPDDKTLDVYFQWLPENGGSQKSLEEIIKKLKKIPSFMKRKH